MIDQRKRPTIKERIVIKMLLPIIKDENIIVIHVVCRVRRPLRIGWPTVHYRCNITLIVLQLATDISLLRTERR